jgi:hypothetical protein
MGEAATEDVVEAADTHGGKLVRTDWNLSPKDEWRGVGPGYNIAIQAQHLL